MDINNHSINEHVFGQSVGPARNMDLLKNKERTNNKHKPKSKHKKSYFLKNTNSNLHKKASSALLIHSISSLLIEISKKEDYILKEMVTTFAMNMRSSMLI
jgi:hypothetical protein